MKSEVKTEFSRTAAVIGEDGINKLSKARVAVFGVGGVGGYVCESLARSGVGKIDIFDMDTVSLSNINRQIIALHSTVGRHKTEVMKERIADINPDCIVTEHRVFYMPENADEYDLSQYDFVVDAIDTVTAKIELAARVTSLSIPFISCMGTGNKLDVSKLTISDISKTTVCPLARVMRRELRARGINHITVLYSTEIPATSGTDENGKKVPASTAFVPAAAGLMIGAHVTKALLNRQ
jgi:tRNA A37 threonylcarbamoyladenosine dehydratase